MSPSLLAGARFAVAVPLLLLLAGLPSSPYPATHSASRALLFLCLIVLLPDLAGMGLYYAGLRRTSASVATLAELCYPLTSLLIGLFLQHTELTRMQRGGLVLLLASVLGLSFSPSVFIRRGAAREMQPASIS